MHHSNSESGILTMPAPGLPRAISRGHRSLPRAQVTITFISRPHTSHLPLLANCLIKHIWMHSIHTQSILQCLAIRSMSRQARINATKPKPKKLEASDVDGTPVSVCDSSKSDCWLMECGNITCVGECVHGGCNGHLYNALSNYVQLLNLYRCSKQSGINSTALCMCQFHTDILMMKQKSSPVQSSQCTYSN